MNIVIIPGFMGHPDEVTFRDLTSMLELRGHVVTRLTWPYLPDDMRRYSFTETIAHARTCIDKLGHDDLVLLGFSMGGVIAALLARDYESVKLGLVVSPYAVGTPGDLAGKYASWQQTGERHLTSSRYGDLVVPFSFVTDAQQYNALEYIRDVRCLVQFIVSGDDEKTARTTSQTFFDAANEPKRWDVVDGAQHKYQYQPDKLVEVNELLLQFIES